jgi:hypothetical protein
MGCAYPVGGALSLVSYVRVDLVRRGARLEGVFSVGRTQQDDASRWHRLLIGRPASWYDALATAPRLRAAEQLVAALAAWGFVVHLLLIGCAQIVGGQLAVLVGSTWLAAMYTPFACVLIYEVLLLILAIPASTTRALALQFQIVSLIILRNSFKDLAALEDLSDLLTQPVAQLILAIDMGGAVVLFGLVAAFYMIAGRRSAYQASLRAPTPALVRFIERKKAIALLLTIVFAVLAVQTAGILGRDAWTVLLGQGERTSALESPTTPLFQNLFTALILADVLLLVLSLRLSDAYQHLFRGAGFVITTIVLRVALSADRPLQVGIAIGGVVFGIAILAIYKAWPPDPWSVADGHSSAMADTLPVDEPKHVGDAL